MFIAAYFVARFLWLPLLACWAASKGAAGRGALWLPIGAGILATIWELIIPASSNIRVDLLLVAPVLMFADGLGGILLAAAAYRQRTTARREAAALGTGAALCLVACVFFIAAWTYSNWKSEDQYKEHVEGSRYFFEAAFRDDDTQRISYGALQGSRWAGYYVTDPPQPSFAHLVVNADGDYFVYSQDFYERRGRTRPDTADAALTTGTGIYLGIPTRGTTELRDLGDGKLKFRSSESGATDVIFVKRQPPRFPRPRSASDQVRFIGVYSGVYEDEAKYVSLAQVWLWGSEGELWAVWLRGSFSRESERPVSGNTSADVTCVEEECATLLVHTEGGRREKLQRQGPNALGWFERKDRLVTLNRGEVVTGLPFAWAPLTTKEENRKWLRSLHPDISWKPPPK